MAPGNKKDFYINKLLKARSTIWAVVKISYF